MSESERPIDLVVLEHHDPADREAILDRLRAFNRSRAGPSQFKPLAILLKDAAGETIGGLWASSFYDWLFVELLFIPEELRGRQFGSCMMKQAEQIAVARGCTGIWVDTFEFQAKGFYEQLGYSVFGAIKDYPRGTSRFFFQKRLG